MALDGGFVYCLAEELRASLLGARVDKIHQPSREELVIAMRSKSGTYKLYMSARVQSPRVHLVSETPENPSVPPMFCMLLRKRLGGGKLVALRQDGLERVLYFDFDCVNELGDPVRLTLSCEMTGRHSNIVLIEGDKIVDAIKRVDFAMSETRPILPNVEYAPPAPLADRLSLLDHDGAAITEAVRNGRGGELSGALLSVTQGLSPLVCREIASLTLRRQSLSCDELTDEQWERLRFYLDRVRAVLLTGERRVPYLLRSSDGTPREFSYMLITQFGLSAVGAERASFSELLEEFYREKDRAERLRAKSHDMLKLLVNASARVERKLLRQREELAASAKRDQKRLYADLLMAQTYAVPPGASEATLVNYYDENAASITVPLDPSLNAAANAQKYYKDYRKAQTAEKILQEQIAFGEQELRYLDSVLDALSRAATPTELAEVRRELVQSGYIRETDKRRKAPTLLGPMRFRSTDGAEIAVGRNNMQNDQLTLRTAKGRDLWFHVKDIPGSHTVLFTEGAEPSEQAILEAAILAATHSKAAASSQVPVDYTLVKHVHKPSGAKPGMVIYEHQKTLYVTPDEQLVARLKDGE
ncbi:MAG: NFACT family protein [Clostridia bacterium]|nr:NFACT family protein [Clostridia bacterium]